MKNLLEATERICELKGDVVALDALAAALLACLPPALRARLGETFESTADIARNSLLHAEISDLTIAAFDRDAQRLRALVGALGRQATRGARREGVEPLLLAVPHIATFDGPHPLTGATGFFFERGERLWLGTNRHVLLEPRTDHRPDRIEIAVHGLGIGPLAPAVFSLPLYRNGRAIWRQAGDAGGDVDVAVLEVERAVLKDLRLAAFTPAHLQATLGEVDVGTPLLIVGFPLGFHDGVNHLPVARQASIASSFGTRFQGQGCFLTDARMHRGSSGAPVVMRDPYAAPDAALPWKLLGVHAARLDMGSRDLVEDESLGLNSAWYADVLMALTND
jgi:Trypsin-like peptidase domain